MGNVFFENVWFKTIEGLEPELKKYESQLTMAKLEFPDKTAIQNYYSQQIKDLNNIVLDAGFPLTINPTSLRMKLIQEYSKNNSDDYIIQSDDILKTSQLFSQLIIFCESMAIELTELESEIETIGYNQTPIENLLSKFESDFDVNQTALSWDHVEADGKEAGYYKLQLSWGGPSTECRIYSNLTEYWYMDWFDGACIEVPEDSYTAMICNMMYDCSEVA